MITWVVDTDGVSGDYASLGGVGGVFDSLPNPFTDDMTIECNASTDVIDDIPYFEYYKDQDGFSLTIKAVSGEEALKDGWDTGRYIARVATGEGSLVETYNEITWEGIQFAHEDAQWYHSIVTTQAANTFRNCRFESGTASINGTSDNVYENCIIIGTNASAVNAIDNAGAHTFANCIFDVGDAITGSTTSKFVNCVVINGTVPTTGTFSYNMVASGTWGTNSRNPVSSDFDNEFVDEANGDYTAVSSGNIQYGVGPSTESDVPSTDMEGDTKSGTTAYMGVDEPSEGIIPLIMNSIRRRGL